MNILVLAAAILVLAPHVQAFDRTELSPESQALLPAESPVVVKLKNGNTLQGMIISRSETGIVLKQTKGSISSQLPFAMADILKIEDMDLCELWAKALKARTFEPAKEQAAATYEQDIKLYKEFLDRCGANANAGELQKRVDFLASEFANLKRGLNKVGGSWLPPVAAAVRRFDVYTEQLAKIKAQYPGVETATYNQNPRAKQAYDGMEVQRREVARGLPKTVTERVPQLIEAADFDLAAEEAHAFMSFWITRVIGAEAAQSDGQQIRKVIEGMDFAYILRLQKQIGEAWYKAQAGKTVAAPATLADNEVYIQGGYFLMGNEAATIGDEAFPYRLVFVSPFVLSKYEVSNAEYRKFVDHVKATGDSSMEHPQAPPLKDHAPEGWKAPELSGDGQPVVGIDWFDAYAYANWKKMRLPTEAEWELAARGYDGRKLAWGDDPSIQPVVNTPKGRQYVENEIMRQRPAPPPQKEGMFGAGKPPPPPPPVNIPAVTWNVDAPLPEIAEPDYFPDTSGSLTVSGARHMIGNAAEWVQDFYAKDFYQTSPLRDPKGPETGTEHVLRGGSYVSDDDELFVFSRIVPRSDPERNGMNSTGKAVAGMRLARSLSIVSP